MRPIPTAALSAMLTLAAMQNPSWAQPSFEQQVVAHEREGLDALKTGDTAHVGTLTADEALFVDAQGPATKAEVLQHVTGTFVLTDYTMSAIHFLSLGPQTGLIEYDVAETGTSHGKPFSAKAYVSSIWTERNGRWQCLFSQETLHR